MKENVGFGCCLVMQIIGTGKPQLNSLSATWATRL